MRGTFSWIRGVARGRVLDIGCADRWVERILPPGCEYWAVDYLATGADMYDARPHIFADASHLPLPAASVDTAMLEHLHQPRRALEEIARVLRPQGRLLLTVPFLYPIHDAPHDYQRLTVHGLEREILAAGLQLENIRPTLGAVQTAGLLLCLALAGTAAQALARRSPALLLLPFIALAIPAINLSSLLAGMLLPTWPALNAGYAITARKP